MKGIQWRKKDNNVNMIIKILVALVFPILMCMFYCIKEGAWIGQLHLASTTNNDTLFYFAQVAGVVEKGYPIGYFGYNESAAKCLSFGAWSPFMYIPWIIWGKLFGWVNASPFWCNMLLFGVVLALFVYFAKLNAKQMMASGVLLILFSALSKYIMSCLAEIIVVCFVTVFYACALGYAKKESAGKLIALFAISSYLTWMRPYFVLLVFLPIYFLFLRNKKVSIATLVVIPLVDMGIYFLVAEWFTAEYFWGLFSFDMIYVFLNNGLWQGFLYLFATVRDYFAELWGLMMQSFQTGAHVGSYYALFFCVFLLVFLCLFHRTNKEDKKTWVVYLHYILSSVISFFAFLLIMQRVNETIRHILCYIVVGLILLGIWCGKHTKYIWMCAVTACLSVYLFHFFPASENDLRVPIAQEEAYEMDNVWKQINAQIELDETQTPSYSNTIIWVITDQVDGQVSKTPWKCMLSAPAGTGISCCLSEYLVTNWENLQSRYICTVSDGCIAKMCEKEGYEKLGESHGSVLYKRY